MNSKKAFERIEQCCVSACLGLGQSPYNRFLQSYTPCKEDLEVVKKDLDRLEKLEKENKELRKENEFLETNIKAIEASNDRLVDKFLELEKIYLELVKEYTKQDQVINILKDKIEFEDLGEMQNGNVYRGYFNDCLDEEKVNSIKEVFEND